MGWFDLIWKGTDENGSDSKERASKADLDQRRVDKYEDAGRGRHVHHGYNLDRSTGRYREYRGGEDSDDRSYNKSK